MTARIVAPLAVLLITQLWACTPKHRVKPDKNGASGTTPQPQTDTMVPDTGTVKPALVASWNAYLECNGKYPDEIGLLENEPLRSRFRSMLGKDHRLFLERFVVTPPVEISQTSLYVEGCKPFACGMDEAVIVVDLSKDAIYAGVVRNKMVKLYSEKNNSGYPDRLLEWADRFR